MEKNSIRIILVFFGALLTFIFGLDLLFNGYNVDSLSGCIISLIFTCMVYLAFPKNVKMAESSKDERLEFLKEEREVRFCPKVAYDEVDKDFEKNMPFCLLDILQQNGNFKCFATYFEEDGYIMVEVQYRESEESSEFYFRDFDMFWKYFSFAR